MTRRVQNEKAVRQYMVYIVAQANSHRSRHSRGELTCARTLVKLYISASCDGFTFN